MQGIINKQKPLFQNIDIDSLLPENHILRQLEKYIDLQFIKIITE